MSRVTRGVSCLFLVAALIVVTPLLTSAEYRDHKHPDPGHGKPYIPVTCENLATMDFGPNVRIDSAEMADVGLDSEHCLVKGAFLPEVDPFVVKLPVDWNGDYYQTGNGGLAGSIDPGSVNYGLARKYASASASGGYDLNDPVNANGKFGYNPPDNSNPYAQQKLDGYCFASVHKMNALGKKIVAAYYGKKPRYAYYKGGSTGGRQGLIEAQRYPTDFNGIMVGCPLVYVTKVTMRDVWQAQQVLGLPALMAGGADMMAKVSAAVYKKCDSIDGLLDGMIDDARQCTFNALSDLPACPEDVPDPEFNCFTTAQRTAIQKIYDGPRNSAGELLFKGTPVGGEVMQPTFLGFPSTGWYWILPITPGQLSLGGGLGTDFTRYCGLPPDGGGPGWDYTTFNWDSDWPYVMKKLSARCDANNPDLRTFYSKGGKLIQYHGWGDALVSPYATTDYYDEVSATMGKATTDRFYKLYMIPGLSHCMLGVGCPNDDGMFDALINWVENKVEPDVIIGSRDAYPPTGMTARTRPLCPYPGVARYLGAGSVDEAENFACVELTQATVQLPETLDLPRNKLFESYITLPEGFGPGKDWKIRAVVCEGSIGDVQKFHMQGHNIMMKGRTIVVTFDAQDLIGIPTGAVVTFTVTAIGEQHGQQVALEGSDKISVYLAP
jgi:hypothetical protein